MSTPFESFINYQFTVTGIAVTVKAKVIKNVFYNWKFKYFGWYMPDTKRYDAHSSAVDNGHEKSVK